VGLACSVLAGGTAAAQGLGRGSIPSSSGGKGGLGIGSYDTKERPRAQRVVEGVVLDKNGAAIKGAIVYLKDDKTAAIKSVNAGDDGKFRFVQLSRVVDYKLWAQAQDKKSPEKVISQFDTLDTISRSLKIE
jgi:hypothetical protein